MKHQIRRILTVGIALILALGLAACSRSPEEQIGKIIGDIADGNTVTTPRSTNEPQKTTSDDEEPGMDWPADRLPRNVPMPSGIKVNGVMSMNQTVIVSLQGLSEEDAEDYIEALQKAGWTIDTEMYIDGVTMVSATDDDENVLSFTWQSEEDATIVYEDK